MSEWKVPSWRALSLLTMTDVPSGLLPEGLSVALVVLFSLALGGLAIGAIWKTLRERRLAREAESPRSPRVLSPGLCSLRGIVRAARGTPPIHVQIGLHGAQWRDHQHRDPAPGPLRDLWVETRRVVKARAFEIVLGTGVRVRVLASDDVALIAPLVERGPYAATRRTVEATLHEGTEVWVDGVLARAAAATAQPHHDRDDTWSITAPPGDRLTVSTVPPALRHGRRASHWQRVALTAGVTLLISQLCLAISFWPLVIHGTRCEAEIDGLHERALPSRGRLESRHSVEAHITTCEGGAVPAGTRVSEDVPLAAWDGLSMGDHVSFVVSSTDPRTAVLGDHAGLSRTAAVVLLVLSALGVVVLYVSHRRSRDWYEQQSIHEGPGPL